MAGKHYSAEQIVAAVNQHELGTPVPELCHKLGIAEATLHRWRQQYGGLEGSEARDLEQLREQNAKLKKLMADLRRVSEMVQEIAEKNGKRGTAARGGA